MRKDPSRKPSHTHHTSPERKVEATPFSFRAGAWQRLSQQQSPKATRGRTCQTNEKKSIPAPVREPKVEHSSLWPRGWRRNPNSFVAWFLEFGVAFQDMFDGKIKKGLEMRLGTKECELKSQFLPRDESDAQSL